MLTNPTNPSVELRRGENTQGTLYQWRVWSKDAQGAPANLGSITSPGAYNYSVKIANPTDGPGAANVGSITLTPGGAHYSTVTAGSRIAGDLTGALVIQNGGGSAGVLDLVVDGDLTGNVVAPYVERLQIGGDLSSVVDLGIVAVLFPGGVEVFGDVSGTVDVDLLVGRVSVWGTLSGSVTIGQTFNPGLPSKPYLDIAGAVTSTGSVTVVDTLGEAVLNFGPGSIGEVPFAGELLLQSGVEQGVYLIFDHDLTATGSVNLNHHPMAGSWDCHGGGSGTIINGGAVTGTLELGNRGSTIGPQTFFAGTATFSSVEVGGRIITENCSDLAGTIHVLGDVAGGVVVSGTLRATGKILVDGGVSGSVRIADCNPDIVPFVADGDIIVNADGIGTGSILGTFEMNGLFNGNLCADNVSPIAPLPGNVNIDEFGPNGRICGEYVCGGAIAAGPDAVAKNRALSFNMPATSTAAGVQTAIRVEMLSLQHPSPPNLPDFPPPDFSAYEVGTCTASGEQEECARWVGAPRTYLESIELPQRGSFKAARLQCTPYYHDWSAEETVHIFGAEIIPSSTYALRLVPQSGSVCATAVTMTTARWGDVVGQSSPSPDGVISGLDVASVLNKFRSEPSAIGKPVGQLQPNAPDPTLDVSGNDVAATVDAFRAKAYSLTGPCPCPSAVPCDVTACDYASTCTGAYGEGAACVKTCDSGPNAGQPCTNNRDCNYCDQWGSFPGYPCDPADSNDCPGGSCGARVCTAGRTGELCATHSDCTLTGTCEVDPVTQEYRCLIGGDVGHICQGNEECFELGVCTPNVSGAECGPGYCRDRCRRCNAP